MGAIIAAALISFFTVQQQISDTVGTDRFERIAEYSGDRRVAT